VTQQPTSGLGRVIVGVSGSHTIRHTHTHTHTHTVVLLWIHNKQKRLTSMPSTEFEPATPAVKRPQTYVLDRAVNWIGECSNSFTYSWARQDRNVSCQLHAQATLHPCNKPLYQLDKRPSRPLSQSGGCV
jgi:hypothetical protein